MDRLNSPKVGLYLRVSSEDQAERGTIESQRDFLREYCRLYDLAIVDEYADAGWSGTIPFAERPEGARLLADVQAGRISVVYFYRLDRLGRDIRVILNAIEQLERAGCTVKSGTEPVDTGTPTGKFLVGILSGVAGLERDTIIERSMAGSNRLAREGAWLGGIAPYGYRITGKGRDARLEVSDELLPGLGLSEADVIRLIYRLSTDDNQSCMTVAHHLNALGIPPSYVKDDRTVLKGKRKEATAGIWRPGRIYNLLRATVYRGVHTYGKRSTRIREIIERPAPAIVTEDVWHTAQATLSRRVIMSRRNAKHPYLLRGIIKCGLCGLTYQGINWAGADNKPRLYYCCDGRHQARGLYGANGQRCPGKAVSASIEEDIWADIVGYLKHPRSVLKQLGKRTGTEAGRAAQARTDLAQLRQALAGKGAEKDAVIALFRRGRIDAAALDRQLDAVTGEEAVLRARIAELETAGQRAEESRQSLESAEVYLRDLALGLEEPMTFARKRKIVEALVERVWVETDEGKTRVRVVYTFESPVVEFRRGARAEPNSRLERVIEAKRRPA